MKLRLIFLFLMTFIIDFSVFTYAPKDIGVEADFENNQLYVKIHNFVTIPHEYYIKRVEVKVDDRAPMVHYFFFQKRGYYKELTIDIPGLDKVNKVAIKAYVEQGGVLEKEFDIQKLKETEE